MATVTEENLLACVDKFVENGEKVQWLKDSFSNLKVSNDSKYDLFFQFDDHLYVKSIIQVICKHEPKLVANFLTSEDPFVWPQFFEEDDRHIEVWFNRFHFSENSTKGSRSLERFAFKHRLWFWDKYLEWQDKKSYTPILVAKHRQYLLRIDTVKTVHRLLGLDSFWKSEEWTDSMKDGELVRDFYSYFGRKLYERYKTSKYRRSVEGIIGKFINKRSFKDLCSMILFHIPDSSFLKLCQQVISVDRSIESCIIKISKEDTERTLKLNCLTNKFRGRTLKYIAEELFSPEDEFLFKKREKESMLGGENNLEEGELDMSQSSDAINILYDFTLDSILRLIKGKNHLGPNDIQEVVCKVSVAHFKLLYTMNIDKECCESFFESQQISFESVEKDRKKKRKRFLGWKIYEKKNQSVPKSEGEENNIKTMVLKDIPSMVSNMMMEWVEKEIKKRM